MTRATILPAQPARRWRPLRIGCAALAVILLILALFLVLKALRILPPARGLLADLRALQALDADSLSGLDAAQLVDLRDRFASIESNIAVIEAEAQPFLPLSRRLGWLPVLGGEVQAATELLAMGHSGATAGRAALDGLLPALSALQAGSQERALSRVLPALSASEPLWQETQLALDQVAAAQAQIDPGALDPRLAHQLGRLDDYLPMLQAGAGMAPLAPTLLGADQPRTYLVLAQNSDELRPPGGFVTGIGLVTFDKGAITRLAFQDSYAVYNPKVDHPPAPPDLEKYMQAQMLLLQDSNWSPDFPTTAAVAQSLYLLDTGQQTDGVIAIDLIATQRLVGALQPLVLPGYEAPVTADNLMEAIRTVWAAPADAEIPLSEALKGDWWRHRKDFMGDLAAAAQAKVEAGQVNIIGLAWALHSSLAEKHILVSLRDKKGRDLLAGVGWDGAMRPGEGDYLLVVDSNVGWNKVNALVQRDTSYRVTLAPDGSARAELDLHYRHTGQAGPTLCVHESRYGDSYADMLQRCYFDYVRVVVPRGATLISAEGFEPGSVETLTGERKTTAFAGFLVLPPGQAHHLHLVYTLPAGLPDETGYQLRVQKQPGLPAWPLEIVLIDPGNQWQRITPPGRRSLDGLVYTTKLAEDIDLVARPVSQ